jgi:hypothetical protein
MNRRTEELQRTVADELANARCAAEGGLGRTDMAVELECVVARDLANQD